MDYKIKIKNVSKSYKKTKALTKLNLEIKNNSFFGLLGPNGAGKTTLIKILTGLIKPDLGEVYINGELMHRNNMKIKSILNVVSQNANLDRELTVYENMEFVSRLYKIDKKIRDKRINELLTKVDLMEHKDKKARGLSGGMKRKLMIAKGLINDPKVLFLDEPTVGIDLNSRRKIWDILKSMKDKTIILTTHYIEEAEYLCDDIGLMDKGKVFNVDTPKNLRENLGEYTVEYFLDSKTKYKHFKTIEEAKNYSLSLNNEYSIRKTHLEDVFYNFTNRKVF
ncbi:MAG: ABC transporter ATP-binding protein [Peptostreptococcaceae bacterium]|nr:ABC transporter ATP-binding protein [Peptostreptococcaceae bacterium]